MREHDGENAANNNTGEGLLCKATAPEEESFPIKKNQPNKQHPPQKRLFQAHAKPTVILQDICSHQVCEEPRSCTPHALNRQHGGARASESLMELSWGRGALRTIFGRHPWMPNWIDKPSPSL